MRCLCVNCGFGCCWDENGHGFRVQRSGTEVEEGVVRAVFGTVKNSPSLLGWTKNVHLLFA